MMIKTQKRKHFNYTIKINDNYVVLRSVHIKYLLQSSRKLYKIVLKYKSRLTQHPPAKS